MFPLFGILIAAALLFSKRKKTPAPVAVVKSPAPSQAKPASTTKASTKPAPVVKKPAPASQPIKSPVQGLPTAGQYTADVFGSMMGTNPKVLNQTLPYGYYDPNTNGTGTTTPPIVATYPR